jgi:hypothetical protein
LSDSAKRIQYELTGSGSFESWKKHFQEQMAVYNLNKDNDSSKTDISSIFSFIEYYVYYFFALLAVFFYL